MKLLNKIIIPLLISASLASVASATQKTNSNPNSATESIDQSNYGSADGVKSEDCSNCSKYKKKRDRKKLAPFRYERLEGRHDRRSSLHNKLEGGR